MTFAEMKNRNRWGHFALGIIFPIVYPVVMYFVFSKVGASKKEEEEEEKTESADPDQIPDSDLKSYADGQGDETGAFPASGLLNQDYFSKISKDETGNFRGPFILELDDGQILEIECIVEALVPAVAVQIGKEAESRTIRLPYMKIQSCKTKRRWLEEAEGGDMQEGDGGEKGETDQEGVD